MKIQYRAVGVLANICSPIEVQLNHQLRRQYLEQEANREMTSPSWALFVFTRFTKVEADDASRVAKKETPLAEHEAGEVVHLKVRGQVEL